MKRALVLLAGVASAAPAEAGRWHWSAPDSCPESSLRTSLALRVDAAVDALPFDVDVSIADDDRGLTATLVVAGGITDSRTLTSASCGELTDALAIVIARLAAVAPAPPPVAVDPTPVAIVEVGPATVRMLDRAPRWNAGGRVAGVVGTGGAASLGVAGELGAWATLRSWSLDIAFSHWKANTASIGDRTMAGVDVGLNAVALRAGWRPAHSFARGWLVGEVGSMRGVGVGLDRSRGGSARWSAVGAGVALAWRVADHVALVAAGEVEFVIDSVSFTLDSGAVLYRTPPVAVRGSLGVEVGWR